MRPPPSRLSRGATRPALPTSHAAASSTKLGGRTKLRPHHKPHFEALPPSLFRETALVVCDLGILPRKELYECWEVATRVHDHFPQSQTIADLASGHGLLGWMLLLLGRHNNRRVVCVDHKMPPSAETLADAFTSHFPNLGAYDYVEGDLARVQPSQDTLLTALHACGPLTDSVLSLSINAGCSAAVMPCCHSLREKKFASQNLHGIEMDDLKAAAKAIGVPSAVDNARMGLLRARRGGDTADRPTNHAAQSAHPRNAALKGRVCDAYSPANARPSRHRLRVVGRAERPAACASIPVGDAEAIAQMAGKAQPLQTPRSIEVSLWCDDEGAVDESVLTSLAKRAAATPEGSTWAAEEEAEAVFVDDASGDAADDASKALPRIEATLCDVYTEPSSGRHARSFRIVFANSDEWRSQISKKETAIWQRRIRNALEARGARADAGFELR